MIKVIQQPEIIRDPSFMTVAELALAIDAAHKALMNTPSSMNELRLEYLRQIKHLLSVQRKLSDALVDYSSDQSKTV